MRYKFEEVLYADLNNRQKENYNYQKISGILASFGFLTIRLSDDWNGADFIAQHISGQTLLRVQLKSRFCIDKKYLGKDLHICFRIGEDWYFVPHDSIVKWALKNTKILDTNSWVTNGSYSVPSLPKVINLRLEKYKIPM